MSVLRNVHLQILVAKYQGGHVALHTLQFIISGDSIMWPFC